MIRAKWANVDEAWLNVANGIKQAAEGLRGKFASVRVAQQPIAQHIAAAEVPRSGNLRVSKRFTEQDKDAFKHEAFAFIRLYFEGSLAELTIRHKHLQTTLRSIDANRFTAVIYRDGNKESTCTISLGGMLGDILYSNNENSKGDSCNESLSVKHDDQTLYLAPMGMSMMFSGRDGSKKLSIQGGADLFWELFIEPLQR